MKLRLPEHVEDQEMFNVAAMVDVVFILLAFFVLTARFQHSEHDMSLKQQANTAVGAAQVDDLPTSIPVHISGSGEQMMVRVGGIEMQGDVGAAVTQQLRQINLPEVPVVIHAGADVLIGDVARVLDSVLASPNKQISVANLK